MAATHESRHTLKSLDPRNVFLLSHNITLLYQYLSLSVFRLRKELEQVVSISSKALMISVELEEKRDDYDNVLPSANSQVPLQEAIHQILEPLRRCESIAEQVQALHDLALRIRPKAFSTDDSLSIKDPRQSTEILPWDVRQQLASTLLRDWSRNLGILAVKARTVLVQDVLIGACGPLATLSAASARLSTPTERSNDNQESVPALSYLDLELLLDVLHQVVLPSSKTKNPSILWIDELYVDLIETPESDRSVASLRQALDPWMQLLMTLPSRVANAVSQNPSSASGIATSHGRIASQLPSWSLPTHYFRRLIQCACTSVATPLDQCDAEISTPNENELIDFAGSHVRKVYFATLVERLVRSGKPDDVALGLSSWRRAMDGKVSSHAGGQSSEQKSRFLRTARGLMKLLGSELGPREASLLCRSIVRQSLASPHVAAESDTEPLDPWITATCLPILELSLHVQDALVQRTILTAGVNTHSSGINVDCCRCMAKLLHEVNVPYKESIQSDNDDSSQGDSNDYQDDSNCNTNSDFGLRRQLVSVAAIWSQSLFVQQTDYPSQRVVSTFLCCGLSLLEQPEDPTSPLVSSILEGVTERLHSTVDSIRKDGMRVGEKLAKRLGQDLSFDELREDEQIKMKDQDKPKPPLQLREKRVARRKPTKIVDPNADYVSDESDSKSGSEMGGSTSSRSSNEDDSIWDDECSLEPYDLSDDEEDLRETPRPRYLQACLDLLRTPETEDGACSRHAAALDELPKLVRSHPPDVADLGPSIAVQILRMENKFSLEDFNKRVLDSLCSLTVEDPFGVGHTLIEEFFKDGSLSNRLQVLSTLNEAALELSGISRLEQLGDTLGRIRYVSSLLWRSCLVLSTHPSLVVLASAPSRHPEFVESCIL